MRGSHKVEEGRTWFDGVRDCFEWWFLGKRVADSGRVAHQDIMGGPSATGNWNDAPLRGGWHVEGCTTRQGRKYVLLLLWEDAYGVAGGGGEGLDERVAGVAGEVLRAAKEEVEG